MYSRIVSWIVPPVVIPAAIVLALIALAIYRALA
jgi:hypothetical protein